MTTTRTLLGKIRLRTSVHRYAMQVMDDLGHPPLMDPVTGIGPRTTAIGLDPLRVLLVGGGLAIGYGVRTRSDAMDGPLVQRLAEATGRGISLENRAVRHVHTSDVVAGLGAAGTHTYHVVVWCPSFAEGLEHLRLRGWRADLHQLVRDLRADRPVPVVLTGMPMPIGRHPAAVLARPWVHRLNHVIAQVAAEYDGVVTTEVEPFEARDLGQPISDPAHFAASAARIAPAVLAALGLPSAARTSAG